MLDERLGRVSFWLLFVGVNLAFAPMHVSGLLGMQRRVYTYPAGLGWDLWNLLSSIGILIVIPGLAAFILNVWRSYRGGEPAPPDPWGGDTLEWATDSPPVSHGWTVLPIVRSRHPVWDQQDIHEGDPKLEKFVHGIADWPLKWRAAVVVGTTDARPQEVYRITEPSILPLVAAIGTVTIFAAEIVKLRWLAGLGALTIIGAAIAWNWPRPAPMSEEEELAFEEEHGVPVHGGGSVVVSRWGIGLSMLFLGIALGALLLGYFYLRLDAPTWPPAALAAPDTGPLWVGAALVLASLAAIRVALVRIRGGDQVGQVIGLVAAIGLVATAVWVQVGHLVSLDVGWTDTAYGSVFHTLSGFAMVVVLFGLIMATMTTVWALMGHHTPRRHVALVNTARFWPGLCAMWLIVYMTLTLTPRWT
jgi:cytochrome c oxidase subunit I+III